MAIGKAKEIGTKVSLSNQSIADFLISTTLFSEKDLAILKQIIPHAVVQDWNDGQTILPVGTRDLVLGLIVSGSAAISAIDAISGSSSIIETLQAKNYFGSVAVLLDTAQPYRVTAKGKTRVLTFSQKVVQQLTNKVAQFSLAIAKRQASRLVQSNLRSLKPSMMTMAPSSEKIDLFEQESKPTPTTSKTSLATADDVIAFVQVSSYTITPTLLQFIPVAAIQEHRMLPLQLHDKELTVGMVNPLNIIAVRQLNNIVNSADIKVVAISDDDYNQAISALRLKSYSKGNSSKNTIDPKSIVYDSADSERESDRAVRVMGDEVVVLASAILAAGIEKEASDIHILNTGSEVKVQFRVGQSLINWSRMVPSSLAKALVARFKVIAGLDITVRRLPQDGRIGIQINSRHIDIRLSTMPASGGEKLVMRIFEAASMNRPLHTVFTDKKQLSIVRDSLNRPHGSIIVAGPTGSGKSSTLYACINERRKSRPDTNVIMVENPIEYRIGDVTQVPVDIDVGFTFAKALRSILRQDPDVIMVGEVRDKDTAHMSLEAGMTGHLLLTSLHANTAIGTIQRFLDLGTQRTTIAQSLSLVIVQRLLRKLCPGCSTTEEPAPLLLESLAKRGLASAGVSRPLPTSRGCSDCEGTGVLGRIPIFEILTFTENVRTALMADQSLSEIQKIAEQEGSIITFKQNVASLLLKKLISPQEALAAVAL